MVSVATASTQMVSARTGTWMPDHTTRSRTAPMAYTVPIASAGTATRL